ncbi:MAG: hypothetical protein WCB70_02445 [Xanthobacteraceae bacterium]
MQVPSILQGESLKRLLQGAAAGAVATAITLILVGIGAWTIFAAAPVAALAQPGLDPLQMMTNATALPTSHYVYYSVVFNCNGAPTTKSEIRSETRSAGHQEDLKCLRSHPKL